MKQNNEIKAKLKKYKDEIYRLKEKIKTQNKDIEEALKLLSVGQIKNFSLTILNYNFFFLKANK